MIEILKYVIKVKYKLISRDITRYYEILRNFFNTKFSILDFLNKLKSSKFIENKLISRNKQKKSSF